MTANIVNQVAYLRTTRSFENDPAKLTLELNKAYLDIATAVNNRIIGIFPTNRAAITGEEWFLTNNRKQQTLRQVFTFTATTAITHGISVITPGQFIGCYGSYTDGTNSYGLVFGTSTPTPGLITFYVTSTQIIFVLGAGAPALTSGRIVLSWLSSP